MKKIILYCLLFPVALLFMQCKVGKQSISQIPSGDTLKLNQNAIGFPMTLEVEIGPEHNYPLMACWICDVDTNYIQTIYVAESIAKGVYDHGDNSGVKWARGERRRPAALPYWSFNRGVKENDGLFIPTVKTPLPDAYTGATPRQNFVIYANTDNRNLPNNFLVFFEVNQTWDWNEFWTNNKFPDDKEYKTSSQPALVYAASFSKDTPVTGELSLIGHSSYNGSNGKLYRDISTITTAKEIVSSVRVTFMK